MAPKRRNGRMPTRMDAALDAMAFMGYKRTIVRKKVNDLLELYQGDSIDDGWTFIESDSYLVLIDALIEQDQLEAHRNEASRIADGNVVLATEDVSPEIDEGGGNDSPNSEAGPSTRKVASVENVASVKCKAGTSRLAPFSCNSFLPLSNLGEVNNTLQSKDVTDSASKLGANDSLLPAGRERKGSSEESKLEKSQPIPNDATGRREAETSRLAPFLNNPFLPCSNPLRSKGVKDSASHNELLNSASLTPKPGSNKSLLPTEGERKGSQETLVTPSSTQPVHSLPTRRRRPYHGWVGREDEGFVELPAAPLSEMLRKIFIITDVEKKKRKSMWDM